MDSLSAKTLPPGNTVMTPALSSDKASTRANLDRTWCSWCESQHRVRLWLAKDGKSERLFLHIGKYHQYHPHFGNIDSITPLNTLSWIATDYAVYTCNDSAYRKFLKIGHIFLDKKIFHQYNLYIIPQYNAEDSYSDDSEAAADKSNDRSNIGGIPAFLKKMLSKEMKNISRLPDKACQSTPRVACGDNATELEKKDKKRPMEKHHNDASTINHNQQTVALTEKPHTAHDGQTALIKKAAKEKTDRQQENNAGILKRKRRLSEQEDTDNNAESEMDEINVAMPRVKRHKTAQENPTVPAALSPLPPTQEVALSSPNTDEPANEKQDNSAPCQAEKITNKTTKKAQGKASTSKTKKNASSKPSGHGDIAPKAPPSRSSRRKKNKRPNILVHDIDLNRSLCWNMENYIINHFFNDNQYQLDCKNMLQKFAKNAKRRRERLCSLWKKYGRQFFDVQHHHYDAGNVHDEKKDSQASGYVDISSEILYNDLDIKSDYETIVKILNGIGARFNTSIKRTMLDGQSAESHFTLHIYDLFDMLRHLDNELMADWYEIYCKNQRLYHQALAANAVACGSDDNTKMTHH